MDATFKRGLERMGRTTKEHQRTSSCGMATSAAKPLTDDRKLINDHKEHEHPENKHAK